MSCLRLGPALLLALALAACSSRREGRDVGPLSAVRYLVDVVAPPAQFDNQLGQRITLSAAYLTYASLGLGRCAVTPPQAQPRKSAALLRELFALPRAHAGHEGVLDPSFSDQGWVINLRRPVRAQRLAERFFPATAYCRAQSVLAGAHESYVGYPSDTQLRGYTLHVRGTVAIEGPAQPFVLETDVPYGALRELPQAGAGEHARLTIRHDLRAALADIDLMRDDAEAASKRLLRVLIDRAQLTFVRAPWDPKPTYARSPRARARARARPRET